MSYAWAEDNKLNDFIQYNKKYVTLSDVCCLMGDYSEFDSQAYTIYNLCHFCKIMGSDIYNRLYRRKTFNKFKRAVKKHKENNIPKLPTCDLLTPEYVNDNMDRITLDMLNGLGDCIGMLAINPCDNNEFLPVFRRLYDLNNVGLM